MRNTIDPVAVVADNGQQIIATGPISCTRGERALLSVTGLVEVTLVED